MPKFLKSGKQAQFDVPATPLTVIMEDEIIHTPDFPVCTDPDCICYGLEREQAIAETAPQRRSHRTRFQSSPVSGLDAPLNGNRSFKLIR